jgi:hypothetical protein
MRRLPLLKRAELLPGGGELVNRDGAPEGFTPAFAEIIRRRREQKGLSQEALAGAAGVHHIYVAWLSVVSGNRLF